MIGKGKMGKKIARKSVKKRGSVKSSKVAEKTVHKRTKRIISGDKIYQMINRVQTQKKLCEFAVCLDDAEVVRNIVKDTGLKVSTRQSKDRIVFKVSPDKSKKEDLSEEDIEETIFSDILVE